MDATGTGVGMGGGGVEVGVGGGGGMGEGGGEALVPTDYPGDPSAPPLYGMTPTPTPALAPTAGAPTVGTNGGYAPAPTAPVPAPSPTPGPVPVPTPAAPAPAPAQPPPSAPAPARAPTPTPTYPPSSVWRCKPVTLRLVADSRTDGLAHPDSDAAAKERGGGYEAKVVDNTVPLTDALRQLVRLQDVMFNEEREAYKQQVRGGDVLGGGGGGLRTSRGGGWGIGTDRRSGG